MLARWKMSRHFQVMFCVTPSKREEIQKRRKKKKKKKPRQLRLPNEREGLSPLEILMKGRIDTQMMSSSNKAEDGTEDIVRFVAILGVGVTTLE